MYQKMKVKIKSIIFVEEITAQNKYRKRLQGSWINHNSNIKLRDSWKKIQVNVRNITVKRLTVSTNSKSLELPEYPTLERYKKD